MLITAVDTGLQTLLTNMSGFEKRLNPNFSIIASYPVNMGEQEKRMMRPCISNTILQIGLERAFQV